MTDDPAQSNTPTPQESTPGPPPRVPAPSLPAPGAVLSAPLAGGGRPAPEEKPKTSSNTPSPPPRPRVAQKTPAPPTEPTSEQPQAAAPPPSAGIYDYGDLAVTSLMRQVLEAQRPQSHQFYLMVYPEDDWPRCEKFTEVDAMVSRIKELLGTPCHLFAFLGQRLTITEGPHRFLMTPLGGLPLFDVPEPEQAAEAEHGWVGPEMLSPQVPTNETGEDEDDEDPDEAGLPSAAAEPAPADPSDTPIFDTAEG